jgi:hypothetical protein
VALDLVRCSRLTALPERLGDCAALEMLRISRCESLTALPERLNECTALTTLEIFYCDALPNTTLTRIGSFFPHLSLLSN